MWPPVEPVFVDASRSALRCMVLCCVMDPATSCLSGDTVYNPGHSVKHPSPKNPSWPRLPKALVPNHPIQLHVPTVVRQLHLLRFQPKLVPTLQPNWNRCHRIHDRQVICMCFLPLPALKIIKNTIKSFSPPSTALKIKKQ